MARTTSSGAGAPTPQLWLRIRFFWSGFTFSGAIRTPRSEPKPVVSPYTTARDSTSLSTTARQRATLLSASGATSTGADRRATAATASGVRLAPSRTTLASGTAIPPQRRSLLSLTVSMLHLGEALADGKERLTAGGRGAEGGAEAAGMTAEPAD